MTTNRPSTQQLIGYMQALCRDLQGNPIDESCPKTVTRQELRALLLETENEFHFAIGGNPVVYTVKNKHLGAGIYHVWLKRKAMK